MCVCVCVCVYELSVDMCIASDAGFLVDYISHPVINSFTTAAAITIAASQLKASLNQHSFFRYICLKIIHNYSLQILNSSQHQDSKV